jgi:hypothetical protein
MVKRCSRNLREVTGFEMRSSDALKRPCGCHPDQGVRGFHCALAHQPAHESLSPCKLASSESSRNRRALIPHRRYRNSTMSPDAATPEPAARTWYPNWYRSQRTSAHLSGRKRGQTPLPYSTGPCLTWLQNRKTGVAHRWVGSTPTPLRSKKPAHRSLEWWSRCLTRQRLRIWYWIWYRSEHTSAHLTASEAS